jgi:hypothetical protein
MTSSEKHRNSDNPSQFALRREVSTGLPGLLTSLAARHCCDLMIGPFTHKWTNWRPDWTTIPNAQMLLFPILWIFPKVPIRFMTPCRVHKAPVAKETIPLFGRSFFSASCVSTVKRSHDCAHTQMVSWLRHPRLRRMTDSHFAPPQLLFRSLCMPTHRCSTSILANCESASYEKLTDTERGRTIVSSVSDDDSIQRRDRREVVEVAFRHRLTRNY